MLAASTNELDYVEFFFSLISLSVIWLNSSIENCCELTLRSENSSMQKSRSCDLIFSVVLCLFKNDVNNLLKVDWSLYSEWFAVEMRTTFSSNQMRNIKSKASLISEYERCAWSQASVRRRVRIRQRKSRRLSRGQPPRWSAEGTNILFTDTLKHTLSTMKATSSSLSSSLVL